MTNDKNKKYELEAEALEFDAFDGDETEAEEAPETDESWAADSRRPIAYIRSVSKDELEAALPPNAPDGPYFALHDEEGRPLAVFTDAVSAKLAARAHNYDAVSVH